MNSSQKCCAEVSMEQDFKSAVSCQKKELEELKRQLLAKKDSNVDGDEPRRSRGQWDDKPASENCYAQTMNKQSATIKELTEKLGKFSTLQCEWELKNGELQNQVDCVADALKSHKSNEKSLISKIGDYENVINCLRDELRSAQSKLAERACEIEKLRSAKKAAEEEVCKLRARLDGLKKDNDRLDSDNRMLCEDLKCARTEANELKLSVSILEESLRNERKACAKETREQCKKIESLQKLYEETKCKLNSQVDRVKELVSALIKASESNEKSRCCNGGGGGGGNCNGGCSGGNNSGGNCNGGCSGGSSNNGGGGNCNDGCSGSSSSNNNKGAAADDADDCEREKQQKYICQLEKKITEYRQRIDLRDRQTDCQSKKIKSFADKLGELERKYAAAGKPPCCRPEPPSCCCIGAAAAAAAATAAPPKCKEEKACCGGNATKVAVRKCEPKRCCPSESENCFKTELGKLVCELDNLKKDAKNLTK